MASLDFSSISHVADSLTIFGDCASDPIVRALVDLSDHLAAPEPNPIKLQKLHAELAAKLVIWAEERYGNRYGDAWQEYLLDLILDGPHAFGRRAAAAPLD